MRDMIEGRVVIRKIATSRAPSSAYEVLPSQFVGTVCYSGAPDEYPYTPLKTPLLPFGETSVFKP